MNQHLALKVVLVVLALVLAQPAWAARDELLFLNPQPVTEELVHVRVRGATGTVRNSPIELLAWTVTRLPGQSTEGQIDIYFDWNESLILFALDPYDKTFSIPAPPSGDYMVTYHAQVDEDHPLEAIVTEPLAIQRNWPKGNGIAFLWPPGPTPLDDTRYYFAPPASCYELFVVKSSVNESNPDGAGFEDHLVIPDPPDPCDLAKVPDLRSVALGSLEPGEHVLRVESRRGSSAGIIIDPMPIDDPVDTQRFSVRPVLPGRLSGSWYNPDQSGHGLSLEVADGGERLLAYWFTFDDLGNQAWIVGDGTVDETGTSATLDALIVQGGEFPPAFDPGAVDRIPWGTIRFDFEDCSTATMSWETGAAGFSDGEMPVERLSTISGYGCTTPPPESLLDNTWRLTPYPVVEESEEPPEGAGG